MHELKCLHKIVALWWTATERNYLSYPSYIKKLKKLSVEVQKKPRGIANDYIYEGTESNLPTRGGGGGSSKT